MFDGLKSGNITGVYILEGNQKDPKILEVIMQARAEKVETKVIDSSSFSQIVRNYDKHQGIAALSKKNTIVDIAGFLDKVGDQKHICVVVLTEIEYEQNLGAILRTLDAAGIDGVIISSRIKNYDSMVVKRVSMGASESVVTMVQNIFVSAKTLKENGFKIIGVESTGSDLYVNEDFSGRIALVFGGEDKGLSQPVIDFCDKIVSIPMLGNVTSLNVSVSVGVTVYERLRQVVSYEQKN